MLYVFLVDTGTMLTFNMSLAMGSVDELQDDIAHTCGVPVDKQVLLISGGENLDPNARVGMYSAGTDTNPIYLFSKKTIEQIHGPSPSIYNTVEETLKVQVEGSLNMPASFETVVARTQLALQFQDSDSELVRCCENLVHDQHLQQQGWAAVVANLDDISHAFEQRSLRFHSNHTLFLGQQPCYEIALSDIDNTIHTLKEISVSSKLDTACRNTDIHTTTTTRNLYEWISSHDNTPLHELADTCHRLLKHFSTDQLEILQADIKKTQDAVCNSSMKEIGGLEDRLYGLEQLMFTAKKTVQEQKDLAQSFVANQSRVSNLNDNSILPDLCNMHKNQLLHMLHNHTELVKIYERCVSAKRELSHNLHTRLRWVMWVQKSICETDSKVMSYSENLRRLRRRLNVLVQLYRTPTVYTRAVHEVIRRRKFTSHYLQWTSEVKEKSSELYKLEMKLRGDFSDSVVSNHFLLTLFPGLGDRPPMFATETIRAFDLNLPPLDDSDLLQLTTDVTIATDDRDATDGTVTKVTSMSGNDEMIFAIDSSSDNKQQQLVELTTNNDVMMGSDNNKRQQKTENNYYLPAESSTFTQVHVDDQTQQQHSETTTVNKLYRDLLLSLSADLQTLKTDLYTEQTNLYKYMSDTCNSMLLAASSMHANTESNLQSQHSSVIAGYAEKLHDAEQRIHELTLKIPDENIRFQFHCQDSVFHVKITAENEALAKQLQDSILTQERELNELRIKNQSESVEELDRDRMKVQEREQWLTELKEHFQAEKQQSFNEALSKLSSEKDSYISSLQAKLVKFKEQASDPSKQESKLKQLEIDLEKMRNESEMLRAQQQGLDPLQNMHLSTTTTPQPVCISLKDFNVGDIVLITIDNRYGNYVIYTTSDTLHFLHSDCVQLLGLHQSSSGSEVSSDTKHWVLGKVTNKEYCQAKKAQNRFKVAAGTKFYRVKAEPWG